MSNVWYLQQIAKMNIAVGRDVETIRRRTQLPPSESTVSFDFDVTLSGANFDVKPTETQKVVSRAEGPGAANLAWTVKPG